MILPVDTARWQQWAVNAVLILSAGVLCAVLFLGYRQDTQGDVIDRVDVAVANQQESAESTRCARQVNSQGEIAQLDALDALAAAFLDLVADNDVGQPTVAEVEALRVELDEARTGYEAINVRCPVPN